MTAYDKNGFRILFHFAKECPPGRPDVLVVVVSMLNTAPLPVKSIVLQAAVPKVFVSLIFEPTVLTSLSVASRWQTPGERHSLQRSFFLSSVNESEVAATIWDRTFSI